MGQQQLFLVGGTTSGSGGPVNPNSSNGLTVNDTRFSPTFAEADMQFLGNGLIKKFTTQGGTVSVGNWYYPTTANIGHNYYYRFTFNSGTWHTGFSPPYTEGWAAMTDDAVNGIIFSQRWYNTYPGGYSGSFTVEFATDSAGTNIVSSGTFTLTAQST